MPSWKKVIVSGSQAHLSGITSSVLSDTNLLIANAGGAIANSGLILTGNTLTLDSNSIISTGPNSILTGSFTGSFAGTFTGNLNSVILANDNNGRQYSTNGGTTASLNTITFRDTDTTSDVTQSIGRIAFESFDTDTSGSNNSQVVRAFIEAVSEDASPDTFLAFGTAQSGSLAQERMRINSSGRVGIGVTTPTALLHVVGTTNQSLLQVGAPDVNNAHLFVSGSGRVGIGTLTPDAFLSVVGTNPTIILRASSLGSPNAFVVSGSGNVGIGTGTPTNTLQVAGSGIATTTLTATGNISSSAGLIGATLATSGNGTIGGNLSVNGNTTLGDAIGDSVTVNAQTLTLANQLAVGVGALSSTMLVITSSNRVATQTLGAGVATFLNTPSSANLAAAVTDETGTGTLVFSASPTFTGTVNAANITATGNLIVTGSTTLGDASGDSVTVNAQTLTLANQLAVGVGALSSTMLVITSSNRVATQTLGAGVATFLNTPSSANLAAAVTDETGTGTLVFSASPTFTGTVNAANITTTGNVVVDGNLTVNGTTTILNVENVMVEDKFILLASGSISGSATHADGGIIVQYTTGSGGSPTGSALFLNSKVEVTSPPNNQTFSARWGLNNSVGHTQTTLNPTDYLVSVTRSQAVPTAAPEFGGQLLGFGNMYIQNNGDIWFWSPDLADAEGNIVYAG